MATLPLAAGGTRSWTASRLNSILASLRLASQARVVFEDAVFMNAGFGLLIVDAEWSVGLRMSEQFEVRPSPGFPFGLVFFDDLGMDVDQALLGSGYSGATPINTLETAFMTYFDAGAGAYCRNSDGIGVSLVQSGGLFGSEPARIKFLNFGVRSLPRPRGH